MSITTIETADVVVIGGGVIGLSLAYYLARRNVGKIVVLEKETIGSGSTGRSVASIDLFSGQAAAMALQVRAYDVFSHFDDLIRGACGLVTTGTATLAGSEQAAALRAAAAVTIAAGVDAQPLSPAAFAELEPAANIEGLATICYVPAGGYADPGLTTTAFASAARRAGVTIRQGQVVTGLTHTGGRVSGVETATGPIATPSVVCAAGPWSGRLLKTFGLADLGLYACHHPVAAFRAALETDAPRLSILDLASGLYARPETGGLTLAGSIDHAVGYDPVEPDDYVGGVSDEYTFWAIERLVQRYPALESGQLLRGWSGLMSISPDWQPLLGAWPEISGLYIAAGFSGQGFKLSPAVGDLMAGLMAGEAEAVELLAPFRLTRFAEGQPLVTSGFVGMG